MTKRRRLLAIIALALLVTNALVLFTLYKSHFSYNPTITYIGLDSIDMLVPIGMRAAKLQDGKWDLDPIPTLDSETFGSARTRPIQLVSLAPRPTYGKAITVFRALKARAICNVLIRESGGIYPVRLQSSDGSDKALSIPALVLCGSSIGDAGFYGVLPADRPIHVDHDR